MKRNCKIGTARVQYLHVSNIEKKIKGVRLWLLERDFSVCNSSEMANKIEMHWDRLLPDLDARLVLVKLTTNMVSNKTFSFGISNLISQNNIFLTRRKMQKKHQFTTRGLFPNLKLYPVNSKYRNWTVKQKSRE